MEGQTIAPLTIRRHAEGPCPGAITIVLEQPGKPVVVLDHELIQRLEATLKLVPRDCTGLVLASGSERVFVAGADLKTIREWPDDQLLRYLAYGSRVFGMLADLPFPTAATINGAALGGGLEVAMHCDALIAQRPKPREDQPAKPYPVGLPEAGLSICPGWGGTNLLPARMNPREAIIRTASGKPMTFDEAESFGLFSRVALTHSDLEQTALTWIAEARAGFPKRDGAPRRWIGRQAVKPDVLEALDAVRRDLPQTEAAKAVVEAIEVGLAQGWQASLESEQRSLTRLRHTPEAVRAIDAFFSKSGGGKA